MGNVQRTNPMEIVCNKGAILWGHDAFYKEHDACTDGGPNPMGQCMQLQYASIKS